MVNTPPRAGGTPPTALLVIDVQQALCTGEHQVFEADQVIARIDALARQARQAGVLVVLVQHESPEGPLRHESDGWRLSNGLGAGQTDLRIRKTAADAFHQTDLHAVLQARGVGHLVICGFQSEFCVDTTTRRALALGYPVTLVSDGHSTSASGILSAAQIIAHHNATLANITSFGPPVRTVPASEVRLLL